MHVSSSAVTLNSGASEAAKLLYKCFFFGGLMLCIMVAALPNVRGAMEITPIAPV